MRYLRTSSGGKNESAKMKLERVKNLGVVYHGAEEQINGKGAPGDAFGVTHANA